MDRHMEGQGIVRSRLLLHRITKPSPRRGCRQVIPQLREDASAICKDEYGRKGKVKPWQVGQTNSTGNQVPCHGIRDRLTGGRDEEDSQQVPQCAAVDKIAQANWRTRRVGPFHTFSRS